MNRHLLVVVALFVTFARSTPAWADPWGYVPPEPTPQPPPLVVPPGYHVETHVRPWLVVTGSTIFGVFYLLAAAHGASTHCAGDRWALVPVVGPLVASGMHEHVTSMPCDDPEGITQGLLIQDGLGQILGASFLVSAAAFPKRELVRDDESDPLGSSLKRWRVVPLIGSAGAMVAVSRTF